MARSYRQWLALLVTASAAAHPLSSARANGSQYSSIVVFGDSLSDNVRLVRECQHFSCQFTNLDASFNGRFSNGPVWAEYVAANLSIPLYDYAIGGSTTSNALVQGATGPKGTIPVPALDEQVMTFIGRTTPQGVAFSADDSKATETPLLVLFSGANDILSNPNISASQSYQVLVRAEAQLRAAHPKAGVLTISPPDLSRIPYGFFADNLSKKQLHAYSNSLGDLLRDSGAKAVNVDLRPLFDDFDYYASPLTYGFDPLGKYGSCLSGRYGQTDNVTVCENPDRRVYWDEYHPTTHAHSWVAKKVLDRLCGPF
ncbi:Thermolabile hemolysin 1 [Colletotrichum chlorophyti]|uniref:Thermolabile hemolysin 1 n=1 Tax=Colletotrichum chlorophyti TaxID=708187 RepID=A0A1Q8RXR4_9PEZI|nr:Thermolabile hemolysin 1 [Colletotrichum chlorophyti]